MEKWDAGKQVGRTFSSELRAQFGGSVPFMSFGENGTFEFPDSTTPEQIAAVKALVAAHDPDAQPPEPARGSALAAVIFGALFGRTPQDKLARGIVLMNASPKVLGFINLLDVPEPSPTRLLVLRAAWASIWTDGVIGVRGSHEAPLTEDEVAAVETLGASYGVPLA